MAEASQTSEAARRYASALFDLAQEKGVLADVYAAFARFSETVSGSKDLSRLIASPLFAREDKANVLKQVAEGADMPDLLARFLGTIAMNGRASELPATHDAFEALYAKQRGVQRAVARTAEQMTDDQRSRLEGIIAKAVGGDVDLTTEVDEDLIGGIQLRIGSTLVDASLKAKLERLNTAMKGA
ncbi:MAG: ATP synthase F1 subunit delta [Pseudomonadota bacterium]